MILLRGVEEKDLDSLERFTQIPGMFNLPSDRELLKERILRSQDSFSGKLRELPETKYTFVAEDLSTGELLATSMIAGQHGTPESPHFYFQVSQEQRYSTTINTGFIHGTLELVQDTDGPSEIGGLVVDPSQRGGPDKVGRQIAFVRFLYAAIHRERFRSKIIAELLPPLNKKGLSPLWEAIGRRFTNMDYWEADQLCAKDKEFVTSLFPSGKIYTTFLAAEARNAIGKVGRDTQPVMHMLQKIGFEYMNQVDPFDGGPHLWAELKDLTPVKKLTQGIWAGHAPQSPAMQEGLVAAVRTDRFKALSIPCEVNSSGIFSTADAADVESALGIKRGDSVWFMPYY